MYLTKVLVKGVYGLVGILFVVVGGSILLLKTGLLPGALRDFIVDFAHGDGGTLHILQEWANAHVLVGLLTLWYIRHYDQSLAYHWAMTAYFAVNALIHWFNVAGPPESATGPLINTVPFVLFALLGLLRLREMRSIGSRAPVTGPQPHGAYPV